MPAQKMVLEADLGGGVEVLQAARATTAKMRTARTHTVRRGLHHFDHLCLPAQAPSEKVPGHDCFTGQGIVYLQDLAIVHAFTARVVQQALYANLEWFGG
jgi:hypothetical protein